MGNSKNPARSRPLSKNVKRLMKMERESPQNPAVAKIERRFTDRDLAYCDMQGSIFMAAVDKELSMEKFAPLYMNSQLAGVIDYSFSLAGGMDTDDLAEYLRIPILLKSPQVIVEVVLWLDDVVSNIKANESANMAVVQACLNQDNDAVGEINHSAGENYSTRGTSHRKIVGLPADSQDEACPDSQPESVLIGTYEYAYWLGYIYRYECLMHDESSRMVYGAFDESFMRDFYSKLPLGDDISLTECAQEICQRLDMLLIGRL